VKLHKPSLVFRHAPLRIYLNKVFYLLIIIFISYSIGIMPIKAADNYPTLTINIYEINTIDDIEPWLSDQIPEWFYRIYVSSPSEQLYGAYELSPYVSAKNPIINKSHVFNLNGATDSKVQIQIILLDWDSTTQNEVSDISSNSGAVSGSQIEPAPRGAIFTILYDLSTNTFSGDTAILDGQYYVTSGDFDGSTNVDQNDASLWFSISDNYSPPKADVVADVYATSVNQPNIFDASSSRASAGSSIKTYQWDFQNDGVYDAGGVTTSYTYTTLGVYTVNLKITDNLGGTSTDTCQVVVSQDKPDAVFTYAPQEPTIKDTVNFYDQSKDSDGSILSWFWSFGDGLTSTLKDPTHKYERKGLYNVALQVTDNDGLTDTVAKSVQIYNLPPVASFIISQTSVKIGREIQFTDSSTDPDKDILTYQWNFGDGFTSTLQNPKHSFTSSGTKSITLTVNDDGGLTSSVTKTVTITPNISPQASFSVSTEKQEAEKEVVFTNKASDTDGLIISYNWSFGDNEVSTEANPVHVYKKSGDYVVTLKVTDEDGATNSITKSITITEPINYPLYILIFIAIVSIIGVIVYFKRSGKKPNPEKNIPPAASSRREELTRISPSVENDTLKTTKNNLEKERINEMLNTFKEKYDKGEINEKTYLKLKKKYDDILRELV